MTITYTQAKQWLGSLWFIVSALLFVFLFVATLNGGGYGAANNKQAWGWLLQCITPTLGLMAAVFVADAQAPVSAASKAASTNIGFLFSLAMGCSLLYLLLVSAIVLWPIRPDERFQALKDSTIYLGPLQGIATTLLGFFFLRSKEKNADGWTPAARTSNPRGT